MRGTRCGLCCRSRKFSRSSRAKPARLVASLFEKAQKGKTKNASWYRLNPDDMAELLGQERRRIVRALEVLEEKGLVELTASDAAPALHRLPDRTRMATRLPPT